MIGSVRDLMLRCTNQTTSHCIKLRNNKLCLTASIALCPTASRSNGAQQADPAQVSPIWAAAAMLPPRRRALQAGACACLLARFFVRAREGGS